jgi:spermidine synthase
MGTVARVAARGGGEIVLRRDADGHYEIISNGTFLMDTRDGRSERLLVDAALAACPAPAPRLLIGGLGVGFSLVAAVRHARVAAITVVEIEPAVIAWHGRFPDPGAADDPRVTVVNADLASWLATVPQRYDVLCLDVDNGPHWTVRDENQKLYGDAGLDRLRSRCDVLAVWSAARVPAFEARLRAHFSTVDVHQVPVARGEPDVVYVMRA